MARLGSRLTLPKPRMNCHPASRRRQRPVCGKKFATRPNFRAHLEEEAAKGEINLEDEDDG